eukprot:7284104-Pyramimonas_sp.AAC.1
MGRQVREGGAQGSQDTEESSRYQLPSSRLMLWSCQAALQNSREHCRSSLVLRRRRVLWAGAIPIDR